MDGLHVQGVAQDKGDLVFGAKIGYPVPGEHALDTDHHIFEKREDDIKQQRGIGIDIFVHFGFTLLVDDAHVHFPCMQIDAAIEFVLLIVKSHGLPPCLVH
jgi:hypothetical protein